ncbi:MAG: TRAM domain-containing protein [Candidatus Saccharimonadales bacterium]
MLNTALLAIILLQTSYLIVSQTSVVNRKNKDKILCDTSALIDGRIVTIARSGFLGAELLIPKSVTRELQYMADKADHLKRERARYGLDVVQQLLEIDTISARIYDDGVKVTDVDEQLITLAKKLQAKLCTTDYNLNKVARTEQIVVVNVNELAHALRPMHLPGEKVHVHIVSRGQNKDQGVGYLDDGSMVVVDNGKAAIGSTIEVETIRVLQTEAGRMVFAKHTAEQKRVPTAKSKTHRTRQLKQSPEDSMIDLANKQPE